MKNKVYIAVSGPSGAGKTTLIEEAEKRLRVKGISVAATLSSTDREPRKKANQTYEIEGVDYRFLTPEVFRTQQQNGSFFISNSIHGHSYGTLRRDVETRTEEIFLMNIAPSGAMELRRRYPDNAVLVFITADIETLKSRLEQRADVPAEDNERRRADMHDQLAAAADYDYIIQNNGDLNEAVEDFCAIIRAQRNRRCLPQNMERLNAILSGLDAAYAQAEATTSNR